MEYNIERVKQSTQCSLWTKVWELYVNSFPEYERRNEQSNDEAMAKASEFYFEVITDSSGRLVGILCYWIWQQLCFVEHLATVPEVRGSGVGAIILKHLAERYPNRLIALEIEPTVDDITKRREGFYLRNGFVKNPSHLHLHPSYSPGNEPYQLLLMSFPRAMTQTEFQEFRRYTFEEILKYSALK